LKAYRTNSAGEAALPLGHIMSHTLITQNCFYRRTSGKMFI